ncbi:MAG: uracil-DNA glycosylase [Treponema sp.]|jgi:DNA polymerase|nr:uracil-DNA glycosylase [Treponema sp.]
MKAEDKNRLAQALDVIADYLGDGYKRPPAVYAFTSGPARPEAAVPAENTGFPEFPEGDFRGSSQDDSLDRIAEEISLCTVCSLHATRNRAVPGEGVSRPLALVIGEGPGADEDASGRPFVGRAGKLLDKMLASIGLFREKNCFIANVVKCRPPGNRDPLPGETLACSSFLTRQIALLRPLAILSVGRVSTGLLLNTGAGIGKLRGHFADYQGTPLLPTYHPSALLRDESLKRPAWEDLKTFKTKLDELNAAAFGDVR